ncbi:hypothetical protein NDU88_004432 [Pleurodeles waltl]|uniref:Uncharacterized protein n=1 Tax=Pleurodeles waltl TaxID=8319 RepID=A0AAV7PGN7_PLEWA|nr:hypothetical protein NDU88_004432 [Pleurodeles waltl]
MRSRAPSAELGSRSSEQREGAAATREPAALVAQQAVSDSEGRRKAGEKKTLEISNVHGPVSATTAWQDQGRPGNHVETLADTVEQ